MKTQVLCILLMMSQTAYTQKEDYKWIMGVGATEPDSIYKVNKINFNTGVFSSELLDKSIPFYRTLGIISDSSGELLCYSNGINIYNKNHDIMENGEQIESLTQFPFGYPVTQAIIILPVPDSSAQYYMIGSSHLNIGITTICNKMHYSSINMKENDGAGKVTEKKVSFYSADSLNIGHIAAVKHGNGRDWWFNCTKYMSNIIHSFLLTSVGIVDFGEQNIGDFFPNGDGNAAFSPSGNWYVNYTVFGNATSPNGKLHLYHFDRCTGILSDPNYKFYPGPDVYGGVAFSPNSRYMYVSKYTKIFQYDLEAPDILASEQTVAEYDGFLDENGVPTRFYGLQLAPDGKIYGNIPNFNSRYIHVIDQPDLPGDSCNVIQHAIYLPAHNFGTLPNLPWYRLYEAEGSPCDTLGVSSQWSPPPAVPAIRVWPIPAADVLHFSAEGDWPEPLDLVLYDALGKAVLSYASLRVSPFAQIDLTVLPPGAYFYTLIRPNGTMVKSGKVVRTR